MNSFTKYLSTAPVLATVWFGFLAGLLIEINRFFELSDGVKFAKFQPIERDNLNAILITRSLIEEERKDNNELIINQKDE
jgi:photosystem I subunit 9